MVAEQLKEFQEREKQREKVVEAEDMKFLAITEGAAEEEEEEEEVVLGKRRRLDLPDDETAVAKAIEFIGKFPGSTAAESSAVVDTSAVYDIVIALEGQLEFKIAQIARRDATILTLKAALAAAQVQLPMLRESQVADEMDPVEQVWLGSNDDGDDDFKELSPSNEEGEGDFKQDGGE